MTLVLRPALSRLSALSLALLLSTAPALAQRSLSDKGVMLDRVAAVVNDGVVLTSELEEQIQAIAGRLQAQGLEMPPASVLRQQLLDRLMLHEIQM